MTEVSKICPDNPERDKIEYAAEVLTRGGIVVFPTDTVYGIGAVVSSPESIRKIYRIKKRDSAKPIVCLVGRKQDVAIFDCVVSAGARALVKRFWPGPLTLIFRVKGKIAGKSAKRSVGLRMPENKIALALLRKTGPIAATSVNISGKKSIIRVEDIEESLKRKVDLIIDGGRAVLGRESTVLDVTGSPYRVLRRGALKERELKA